MEKIRIHKRGLERIENGGRPIGKPLTRWKIQIQENIQAKIGGWRRSKGLRDHGLEEVVPDDSPRLKCQKMMMINYKISVERLCMFLINI